MLKEIEEIRKALISIDALDEEAREALATLEAAVDEIDRHPEVGRVKDIMEGATGPLGGKWRDLKEAISDWEEDHPSIVLAIGRVSDSLAAVGL